MAGMAEGGDKELQEFLMMEQQKAQFQTQIHTLANVCWDKCMGKPGNYMDSRTETCVSNCVERFIDTSLQISQRFQQMLQQKGAMQ